MKLLTAMLRPIRMLGGMMNGDRNAPGDRRRVGPAGASDSRPAPGLRRRARPKRPDDASPPESTYTLW